MSKKIRLTETELVNLVKRSSSDVQPSKKSIPFESIQEYMSNEFNTKNNKKVSIILTFDGQNVVADMRGAKYVVTRN
jgi:hypothetical protein